MVTDALRQVCLLNGVPHDSILVVKGGDGLSAIGSGVTKLICSYGDSFEQLWGIENERANIERVAHWIWRDGAALDLLLVWDRLPDSSNPIVSTDQFLTPVDWAVALSRSIIDAFERQTTESGIGLQIIVVVCEHVRSASPSMKYVKASRSDSVPGMPWIRVMPVMGECTSQGGAALRAAMSPVVADWVDRLQGPQSASMVAMTATLWSSILASDSDPENRHAISNVLGPMLVLGRPPKDAASDVVALGGLLRVLRLLPLEENAAGLASPWRNSAIRGVLTELRRCSRMLSVPGEARQDLLLDVRLVDDMWKLGWGEAACHMMDVPFLPTADRAGLNVLGERPGFKRDEDPSGEQAALSASLEPTAECAAAKEGPKAPDHGLGPVIPEVRLRVSAWDSPEVFLGQLESDMETSAKLPWAQRLGLGGDTPSAPILLLDIRLFSGRPDSEEAAFLQRVVALLRKARHPILSDNIGTMPTPRTTTLPQIDSSELDAIDQLLSRVLNPTTDKANESLRASRDYFIALALLPRLLSIIDPTLPIVIFSSTANRITLDALTSYQNVINADLKPRLSAAPIAWSPSRVEKHRNHALLDAFRLLCARLFCSRLTGLGRHLTIPPATKLIMSTPAVDLYLDETGQESAQLFAVGGLIVTGEKENVTDYRSEASNRVRAFMRKCPPSQREKIAFKDDLRATVSEVLKDLEECAKRKAVSLAIIIVEQAGIEGSIARGGTIESWGASEELWFGDNQFRKLVRRVIESGAAVLPRVVHEFEEKADPTVVSAYLGTRIRELDEDHHREVEDRWGLSPTWVAENAGLHNALQAFRGWCRSLGPESAAKKLAEFTEDALSKMAARYGGTKKVRMIGHSDARAIVDQALSVYRGHDRLSVYAARAQKLNDPTGGAVYVHFIADAVLTLARENWPKRDNYLAVGLNSHIPVYWASEGRALTAGLHANRAMAEDDLVRAMTYLVGLDGVPVTSQALLASIYAPLVDAVGMLSGPEIVRLGRTLAAGDDGRSKRRRRPLATWTPKFRGTGMPAVSKEKPGVGPGRARPLGQYGRTRPDGSHSVPSRPIPQAKTPDGTGGRARRRKRRRRKPGSGRP